MLCVDRFDQFRPLGAILVNLEEGGTFCLDLPGAKCDILMVSQTMIIRFKSVREITNKVADNIKFYKWILGFIEVFTIKSLFLFDGNLLF